MRPRRARPPTFTGRVRVERIFKATEPAPYTAAYVTFEPGARTFWHSHVAGQHLIVVHGVGLTARPTAGWWKCVLATRSRVPAQCEALARGHGYKFHDPHCHYRHQGRQEHDLA